MCPPNDILGSVYSMADMYRSRKMIETRSEIIISAVAMTVTYSNIGSREICTCYWFFYLLYFLRTHFFRFLCVFLLLSFRFYAFRKLSLDKLSSEKYYTYFRLSKVIQSDKTSDVQTLLPM